MTYKNRLLRIFRNLRPVPTIIRSLLLKRIIFVFQMGKVGSNSVFAAIEKSLEESKKGRYFVDGEGRIHIYENSKYTLTSCHRIVDLRGFYGSMLLWRARLGLPLAVICPIREPIARDISGFINAYCPFKAADLLANTDLRGLEELFLTDDRPTRCFFGHQFALNWFDEHLKPLTGIDVYQKPFPIDRKWQTYSRGFIRVLLYRVDLPRSEQTKLISRFLGIRLDDVRLKNASKDGDYAKLYAQFCESAKLPEQYVRRMHDSRFAQHFWSLEELKAAADKWRVTPSS